MNARRLNLYAFLIVVSIITYGHMKKCRELPWPPQYIYTALVFAMLDIFSLFNEEIAGVTSIGFVIAVTVGTFNPNVVPGQLRFFADCEHGGTTGTGQPSTTAYLGSTQSPTTASIQEFQQQSGQQTAPANAPGQGGTTLV